MVEMTDNKGFECSRLHSQCQAQCCGNAPIDPEIYERNLDKRLEEVVQEIPFRNIDPEDGELKLMVLPVTESGKCTFLKRDLTCNIYDDRPEVCRRYGNERHLMLTCPYQAKDGRIRSRQERRSLLRKVQKKAEATAENYRKQFEAFRV